MSEAALRQLQRSHAQEPADVWTSARLLAEKRRCGLIPPWGLEIAAYLGHEGARELVPCPSWWQKSHVPVAANDWTGVDGLDLPLWLRGLQRWRPDRLWWVAGACAAGRVAEEAEFNRRVHEAETYIGADHPMIWRDQSNFEALEVAEAWVDDPCAKNVQRARDSNRNLSDGFDRLLYAITDADSVCANGDAHIFRAIVSFARIVTPQSVRKALCREWLRRALP